MPAILSDMFSIVILEYETVYWRSPLMDRSVPMFRSLRVVVVVAVCTIVQYRVYAKLHDMNDPSLCLR